MRHTAPMLDRARWTLSRLLRRAANRIQPWDFLDAGQDRAGIPGIGMAAVLRAWLAAHGDPVFVLVGANAGSEADPLSRSIRELGLRGLMVEPQAAAFARLTANYGDLPEVMLERAAIAPADGEATLYKARPDFWARHGFPGDAAEIASLDKAHVRRHVALFGGERLAAGEAAWLETESVPALTLATLLAKRGIARVDLLQIDTEGFDFEVLKMVDWAANPPGLVHFESVHLSATDRDAAWALLRGKGYELFAPDSYNTLGIRMA